MRGEDRILRAPGREILTLLPGGHYEFASGSSLAAAHVTGTVALLLAQDRHLDPGGLSCPAEPHQCPNRDPRRRRQSDQRMQRVGIFGRECPV